MDYGHQKYLDKLAGEEFTTARALEKCGRRLARDLYEQKSALEVGD